jgi:5'-3' exonuclease
VGVTRKVLVVDGNNLVMRSVKAAENRLDLSVDDIPTGPLHLCINMLSRFVRTVKPDRMVVCWDGGRSTYRTALYPAYKGERREHDPDAPEMFAYAQVKEFLSLSGIHHVQMDGVEADDLVAHYWRIKENHERVVILSGDKDFLQLLDGWTEQIRPGNNDDVPWTANRVRTEMGCKPEHVPLVMALTGDQGDGVPGVPGFGTKTAVKFLAKYDWDLERLLSSPEQKIAGWELQIRTALALVDLRDPLPYNAIGLPQAPPFRPTDQTSVLWGDLVDFLNRWQLAQTKDRLQEGTLWVDSWIDMDTTTKVP